MTRISIIIPAKNEAESLSNLLPKLTGLYPDAEILVVNDGSQDDTVAVCEANKVECISHPYNKGNGASIKSGARKARGDVLLFMDADGQHRPEDIKALMDKFDEGYDMVVGARDRASQAGVHRAIGNKTYNMLATRMVEHNVEDLTSGFRIVRAEKFRQFLYLLPNGFSYPTTITMAFFRSGYSVAYISIVAPARVGKSNIRLFRDGFRFFIIIFKISTLYSPLKMFLPISMAFFASGLGYYIYTFLTQHRFTNMSALLFVTAVLVFLIGLVSEQITALHYKDSDQE